MHPLTDLSLEVNTLRGTVTMRYVRRHASTGIIAERLQRTVPLREFERALVDAEFTVPWQEVAR